MTQELINSFNKKCAEFLGIITDNGFWIEFEKSIPNNITGYYSKRHHIEQLCFHSDWNWIHELLDKIDTIGQSGWMKNHAVIFVDGDTISLMSVEQGKRQEATIKAIDQFIDWYNEQKK